MTKTIQTIKSKLIYSCLLLLTILSTSALLWSPHASAALNPDYTNEWATCAGTNFAQLWLQNVNAYIANKGWPAVNWSASTTKVTIMRINGSPQPWTMLIATGTTTIDFKEFNSSTATVGFTIPQSTGGNVNAFYAFGIKSDGSPVDQNGAYGNTFTPQSALQITNGSTYNFSKPPYNQPFDGDGCVAASRQPTYKDPYTFGVHNRKFPYQTVVPSTFQFTDPPATVATPSTTTDIQPRDAKLIGVAVALGTAWWLSKFFLYRGHD